MKKPIPLDIRHKLGLETARLLSKTEAGEYPLRQLFWECTLRCNLRCRHCGSDCKQDSMAKDMPGEDFMKVLDRIAAQTDPHKVFVIVTGGEPLVRTDIERWGAEIYRKGFPWGMVTNGFALTEKRLERLKSAGIHECMPGMRMAGTDPERTGDRPGTQGRSQNDLAYFSYASGIIRPFDPYIILGIAGHHSAVRLLLEKDIGFQTFVKLAEIRVQLV